MNISPDKFKETLNSAIDRLGAPPKHRGRSEWLAEFAGVSISTSRKWLEGDGMPRKSNLRALAAKLGLTDKWEPIATPIDEDEFIDVPVYASYPQESPHECLHQIDVVKFSRRFLVEHSGKADPKSLFMFCVHNDCMWPTTKSGDTVMASMCGNAITENAIFILQHKRQILLRRLQYKLSGQISVQCDNENYEHEFVEEARIVYASDQASTIAEVSKRCSDCKNHEEETFAASKIHNARCGNCFPENTLLMLGVVVWICRKQ